MALNQLELTSLEVLQIRASLHGKTQQSIITFILNVYISAFPYCGASAIP